MYNILNMYRYKRRRSRARKCTTRKRAKTPTCFAVQITPKDVEEGFLRFRATPEKNGKITYVPTVVKKLDDASRFTQTKTTKERLEYLSKTYGFTTLKAIYL